MATTSIMPLHTGKGRSVRRAIQDSINYVKNPDKTDEGRLVTSYQCNGEIADAEFLLAKRQYIAATGRVRGKDDIIAYHLRQSFVPGEITPEEANRLGQELAKRFTKGNHAFIVCTHIDKAHVHNHIIWNAVNLDCDRKFRNFLGSTRAVRRLSDTICIENGYSIVENPKPHSKSYNKWLGDAAKPSHRETLRLAIDRALEQKPTDLDTLLAELKSPAASWNAGASTSRFARLAGKRPVRLRSLGKGYTQEDLTAVLAGTREHTPRKVPAAAPAAPKVNLLVDIQAKLQAGKAKVMSAGPRCSTSSRWPRPWPIFQSMTCWTTPLLRQRLLLRLKGTTICGRRSSQRKSGWRRSAPCGRISSSTPRPVTPMWPTARRDNSKKFLEAHREEITLHKAAKDAFDKLGLKKLPKVKDLNAAYAEVLSQKKKLYPEYRRARDEMQELLTVKANVDRVLNMEAPEAGREKDHSPR